MIICALGLAPMRSGLAGPHCSASHPLHALPPLSSSSAASSLSLLHRLDLHRSGGSASAHWLIDLLLEAALFYPTSNLATKRFGRRCRSNKPQPTNDPRPSFSIATHGSLVFSKPGRLRSYPRSHNDAPPAQPLLAGSVSFQHSALHTLAALSPRLPPATPAYDTRDRATTCIAPVLLVSSLPSIP